MPQETGEPIGIEKFERKARIIVDKAINGKGVVASLHTTSGRVQSFEDSISPAIWENYLSDAMSEVDNDNWQNAHEIARNKAIGNTARTLMNTKEG